MCLGCIFFVFCFFGKTRQGTNKNSAGSEVGVYKGELICVVGGVLFRQDRGESEVAGGRWRRERDGRWRGMVRRSGCDGGGEVSGKWRVAIERVGGC